MEVRQLKLHPKLPSTIDAIAKHYFQLEFLGEQNLDILQRQNALLVMNHTAFFALECYLLGSRLLVNYPQLDLRTMVWKGFIEGPSKFWFQRLGCTEANVPLGKQLLSNGQSVLIMPEGIGATDVRKRFNHFHTGYLRMLEETGTAIIPIGFYGVDQAIPWIVLHNRFLENKLMKPISPDFDFLLLPKLPIFRPTKIVFNVGEPIRIDRNELSSKQGLSDWNQRIKGTIESLVDEAQDYRRSQINKSMVNRLYHRIVEGTITELKFSARDRKIVTKSGR